MDSEKKITLEALHKLLENTINNIETRISNLERFLPLLDPIEEEEVIDIPKEFFTIFYIKKNNPKYKGLDEKLYFYGIFEDGLRWGSSIKLAKLFHNKQIALEILDLVRQTVYSQLHIELVKE